MIADNWQNGKSTSRIKKKKKKLLNDRNVGGVGGINSKHTAREYKKNDM